MFHSFQSKVDYYKKYIERHSDWAFQGVYGDYGISSTKAKRPEFNKMLDEARRGNIDLIITKSISRFAINTRLLLKTIRELKELKVDVYFEEQNISMLSGNGEFLISLLASFVEAEAKSMSENVKWTVDKLLNKAYLIPLSIFMDMTSLIESL